MWSEYPTILGSDIIAMTPLHLDSASEKIISYREQYIVFDH